MSKNQEDINLSTETIIKILLNYSLEFTNIVKISYLSENATLVGVHAENRASGITGESKRILGSEMYGIFAL